MVADAFCKLRDHKYTKFRIVENCVKRDFVEPSMTRENLGLANERCKLL
jgi:hypothetical protein